MRRIDENPSDPSVTASLRAIDSTLAGEPVDPAYAELAEIALLLAADRPGPTTGFADALDQRVARRFAPVRPASRPRRALHRWWLWSPAAGLAAVLIVAIAIVLGGSPTRSTSPSTSSAHDLGAAAPPGRSALAPAPPSSASNPVTGTAAPAQPVSPAPAPVLQPPSDGRKLIQAGQLELGTAPSRIDQVAQEVFVVVGQANGIVNSSTVTATGGPGGWAQFQLSIPSASLPQTMAGLSSLRYARVVSRTDTTQDVTDQYQADVRRLADDRARRTSLLKQLANATTQAQIDSLTAQIHDADAAISSDELALRGLSSQINYSHVTVTINGGDGTPVGVHTGGSGGFTLGRAAHDAGRVLTVAAGVALVGAAALLPVSLLVALAWWIAAAVRRRRRQQALDLV